MVEQRRVVGYFKKGIISRQSTWSRWFWGSLGDLRGIASITRFNPLICASKSVLLDFHTARKRDDENESHNQKKSLYVSLLTDYR